ncbi:hypothetical protein ACX0GZ_10045 [Sphingomonas aestuarii]
MEVVAVIVVVILVAYHVISSARRQTAMLDHLSEHIGLSRQTFPGMLASDRRLRGIETAIKHLEINLIGGNLAWASPDDQEQRYVDGEFDDLKTAFERMFEKIEMKLVGGAIMSTGPDGKHEATAVTGELERISHLLDEIHAELKYSRRP